MGVGIALGKGKMTLYLDDRAVANGDFRTQSGHYALCGEGLCIGYDSGDAVSSEYKAPERKMAALARD